jgi:subtilisin-like proprotein convertase family protein
MKKTFALRLALACLGVSVCAAFAWASVPERLHYQGYLTNTVGEPIHCPDAETCPDGAFSLSFKLYDAAEGGEAFWSEVHDAVWITHGVVDAELGAVEPISADLLGEAAWLGLSVNGGDEMLPRQRMVSAAYALRAGQADTAMWCEDAQELGGMPAASYVTAEALPGMCVTQESLLETLSSGEYVTATYLTENGYIGGDELGLAWGNLSDVPVGLDDGDDDSLADLDCAEGAVPVMGNAGWTCGAMTEGAPPVLECVTVAADGPDLSVANGTAVTCPEGYSVVGGGGYSFNAAMGATVGDVRSSWPCGPDSIGGTENPAESWCATGLLSHTVARCCRISGSGASQVNLSSFSDLEDVPADLADGDDDSLASLSCQPGQFAQWSGSAWVCADAPTGEGGTTGTVDLPLITNIFDETYENTDSQDIPDSNPGGLLSEIAVEYGGTIQSLQLEVHATSSDISGLTVALYSPTNAAYTLHDKSGAGGELNLALSTDDEASVLSPLVGTGAKGVWRLIVSDWVDDEGDTDGQLVSWSLAMTVESDEKAKINAELHADGLVVNGPISVSSGLPIYQEPLACSPGWVATANGGGGVEWTADTNVSASPRLTFATECKVLRGCFSPLTNLGVTGWAGGFTDCDGNCPTDPPSPWFGYENKGGYEEQATCATQLVGYILPP